MKWIQEETNNPHVTKFQFVFPVGSISDPPGKSGLNHFLGEFLLRGTGTQSFEQWVMEFESLGASIDVHTTRTQTAFHLSVLKENEVKALKKFGEVFEKPGLSLKQMEILKKSILGEIRNAYQDTQWLAARGILMSIFSDEPVSHPITGTESSVWSMRREDFQDQFHAYYTPDHLVVGSTGTEIQGLESMVEGWFGGRKSDKGWISLPKPEISGKKLMMIDRGDLETLPFYLCLPGVEDSHPDKLALELGNFAFGSEFTSRLTQELRVKSGWTYYAGSSFHQILDPQPTPTLFTIFSAPSVEALEPFVPRVFELLSEFIERGVSEQEFEFAQASLANSYLFESNTPGKRLSHRMREVLTGKKFDDLSTYQKKVQAMSLDEVNAKIKEHLSLDHFVLSLVGPAEQIQKSLEKTVSFDLMESRELSPEKQS